MSAPMDSRGRFLKQPISAAGLSLSALTKAESLTPASSLPSMNTQQDLPRVRVDNSGHYLETEHGDPFFWLGDTAWQLIDATTASECSYYLHARATQGFNVIQACILSEMDGIRKPSALGLRPFHDEDPSRPDERYFDRVSAIVKEAGHLGLYVALLPTWGDKLTASQDGKSPTWGAGPKLFRRDNLDVARNYGRYLGRRFANDTNLLWMLGGDRPARPQPSVRETSLRCSTQR